MTVQRTPTARLLGVLAHELRNPLASVQGCAQTLLERREDLSPEVRDGLTRVIVGQSQRLDWLIRATAALGGASGRAAGGHVDLQTVVTEAARATGATVEICDATPRFAGDERRVQLALEALMLALSEGGATALVRLRANPPILDVVSGARDLTQGERRWKLVLARRLLREERCRLAVRQMAEGTSVRVRFPAVDHIIMQEEES